MDKVAVEDSARVNVWDPKDWENSYNYLSLTLQEVQHIRSVITKAEMESLGVTKEIREDLENGRICFTCLKQRFSIFGPWPVKCKLCERSICERCATTLHVPTECFSKVPIFMLSPSSPTPSMSHESESSGRDSHQPKNGNEKKSGLLMKLCRDCLLLARNIKDGNEGTNHHHHGLPNNSTQLPSLRTSSNSLRKCNSFKSLS